MASRLDQRTISGATAALLIGVFAVGSEALVISPLLVDIARDLHTGIQGAGLSVSVYGLAVAITAPAAGRVADMLSRRLTILLGLAIFAVAGALCAVAPTLAVLVAGRALCGLGAGLFLPAAYAWVGDEVAYEDRARIMGRVVAGWAAAIVLGVPIGGFIGQIASWREALAAMAVFALIAAIVALRLIPSESSVTDTDGQRPGIREALAVPGVRLLLTVNLLDMLAFYGVYTYLGTFIRDQLNVRSAVASSLILIYGIGVAETSFNGRVLDRFGKERALLVSLGCLAVIFAVLPLLGGVPIALGVLLAVFGAFQAVFLTCMATVATQTSNAVRGSVVALMSCTSYIGVTVGAAVMGPIFDGPGYWLVGLISAGLTLAAAALWSRRGARTVVA